MTASPHRLLCCSYSAPNPFVWQQAVLSDLPRLRESSGKDVPSEAAGKSKVSETRGLRGCRMWLCLLVRGLRDGGLLCGIPLPWWCCAASSLPPAPLLWGEGDSKSPGLSLICSLLCHSTCSEPLSTLPALFSPVRANTQHHQNVPDSPYIAQCCVGKAFWGCTQCAGPGSRRRWHLLALRNLPAGRAVLGGGLFAASPRPRGSLPCGFLLARRAQERDSQSPTFLESFSSSLSLTVSFLPSGQSSSSHASHLQAGDFGSSVGLQPSELQCWETEPGIIWGRAAVLLKLSCCKLTLSPNPLYLLTIARTRLVARLAWCWLQFVLSAGEFLWPHRSLGVPPASGK